MAWAAWSSVMMKRMFGGADFFSAAESGAVASATLQIAKQNQIRGRENFLAMHMTDGIPIPAHDCKRFSFPTYLATAPDVLRTQRLEFRVYAAHRRILTWTAFSPIDAVAKGRRLECAWNV